MSKKISDNFRWYPIKFTPILKNKIWGGEKLQELLHKKTFEKNIGESWEISNVEKDTSIVANGILKGESLKKIVETYKEELVGTHVFQKFGTQFPLLVKFIDAKEDLSIQLHPDDTLAQERHNCFGKTEMWYVIQADKGASLITGFKRKVSSEEYLHHLKNKRLPEILKRDTVKEGDVYFINPGTVHSIGSGVLLAEIQQASDITYRLYDWDRRDVHGNYRELHTEQALEAVNYGSYSAKIPYVTSQNKTISVVTCPYFSTNLISLDGRKSVDPSDKDSFVIYMCVSGKTFFDCGNDQKTSLVKGETLLIPAVMKKFTIHSSEESTLLEIFIT